LLLIGIGQHRCRCGQHQQPSNQLRVTPEHESLLIEFGRMSGNSGNLTRILPPPMYPSTFETQKHHVWFLQEVP
jgi:hypothetical protein